MGEIRVGSPAAVQSTERGKVGVNWVKHAGRGPSNIQTTMRSRLRSTKLEAGRGHRVKSKPQDASEEGEKLV